MTEEQAIADLLTLEADRSLLDEEALGMRIDALEQLAFIAEVLRAAGARGRMYGARVAELRLRLEEVNRGYYGRIRAWLQSAKARTEDVRALLACHTAYGRPGAPVLHLDYEPVDALVDGVLELESFSGLATIEDPDIVHLEDTPVRVLLDLVDHVPLEEGDCFFDLGSGLGRATILVHWLTGAPARGVEIQPDYYSFSLRLARSFALTQVSFECTDAREADLSAGTVFYLFTPFKGRILRAVLDRLRAEAEQRSLTVCTYGAVSLVVAREPWLRAAAGQPPHEFSLGIWRSR